MNFYFGNILIELFATYNKRWQSPPLPIKNFNFEQIIFYCDISLLCNILYVKKESSFSYFQYLYFWQLQLGSNGRLVACDLLSFEPVEHAVILPNTDFTLPNNQLKILNHFGKFRYSIYIDLKCFFSHRELRELWWLLKLPHLVDTNI